MAKKKAKSPYAKYRKAPFRYHESFREWGEAMQRGDQDAARSHSHRHEKFCASIWGPMPRANRRT